MNIERGMRRLFVLVTVVLVLTVVGFRILLSQPPMRCTYSVTLANGTLVQIAAPQDATVEQVQIEARRLYPETENPVVGKPIPKGMTAVPPPPDAFATPTACISTELWFGRFVRYAYEAAVGVAFALVIAAVLWIVFFALRWVARGFKSPA